MKILFAKKSKVERMLILNLEHFIRVWPGKDPEPAAPGEESGKA